MSKQHKIHVIKNITVILSMVHANITEMDYLPALGVLTVRYSTVLRVSVGFMLIPVAGH